MLVAGWSASQDHHRPCTKSLSNLTPAAPVLAPRFPARGLVREVSALLPAFLVSSLASPISSFCLLVSSFPLSSSPTPPNSNSKMPPDATRPQICSTRPACPEHLSTRPGRRYLFFN